MFSFAAAAGVAFGEALREMGRHGLAMLELIGDRRSGWGVYVWCWAFEGNLGISLWIARRERLERVAKGLKGQLRFAWIVLKLGWLSVRELLEDERRVIVTMGDHSILTVFLPTSARPKAAAHLHDSPLFCHVCRSALG